MFISFRSLYLLLFGFSFSCTQASFSLLANLLLQCSGLVDVLWALVGAAGMVSVDCLFGEVIKEKGSVYFEGYAYPAPFYLQEEIEVAGTRPYILRLLAGL